MQQSTRFIASAACVLALTLQACGADESSSGGVATETGGSANGAGKGGGAGVGPGGTASSGGSGVGVAGAVAAAGSNAGGAGSDGGGAANSGGAPGTSGSSSSAEGGNGGATVAGTAGIGGVATGGGGSNAGGSSGGAAGSSNGGASGAGGAGGTPTGDLLYVSPSGKATNDGKSFATSLDFPTAIQRVAAGQTILLQAGKYSIASTGGAKNTITLSKSGQAGKPISVQVDAGGRAVFDFGFAAGAWVQDSFGFLVTGNYWSFKNVSITRAGYQGAYVTGQHNSFENCAFHDNRNSGLEINEGGAYTSVTNCDSYRNYDPKKHGSMADGFASKQQQGAGNTFIGCRAWENSDDGFDTFDSPQPVVIQQSWAFRNGIDYWNDDAFAGNGNGFKLGGNYAAQDNRIERSVAFGNPGKGFDQNHNTGSVTLYNNTSYKNGINYGFCGDVNAGETVVFRNNVSLAGTKADSVCKSDAKNNTWNGAAAAESDFLSVDTAIATAARGADGSLPVSGLFRLSASSKLIDKGTNVGLPYQGGAPDLGAFELR